MQETRHTATAVRYLYGIPGGLVALSWLADQYNN